MNMKRFSALVVCLLMFASLAACKSNEPSIPLTPPPENNIELEDATGSPLLGEWTVTAQSANFTAMTFNQNGSLEVKYLKNILGGVFTDDGTTVNMTISGNTLTGTYTVDGDTITITTANDVLVLTKQ